MSMFPAELTAYAGDVYPTVGEQIGAVAGAGSGEAPLGPGGTGMAASTPSTVFQAGAGRTFLGTPLGVWVVLGGLFVIAGWLTQRSITTDHPIANVRWNIYNVATVTAQVMVGLGLAKILATGLQGKVGANGVTSFVNGL